MKPLSALALFLLVLGTQCAFGQVRTKQQQRRMQNQMIRRAEGQRRLPPRLQARLGNVPPQLPPSLKQSLNAYGRIRFSGTRVIEAKNGVNRVQHTEFVLTDGPNSRIEFPKESLQSGQVIVEDANQRQQYLPGRNEMQTGPAQRDDAMLRLVKMAGNPNLSVTEAGGGSVAGLPTQLVTIADKQGSVKQRLWIEPRSGMILKRELYDKVGAIQASFEFTQVNLNPIIRPGDFKLTPPANTKVITPEIRAHQIAQRQQFLDVQLPVTGTPYKMEGARMQKMAQQEVFVQQYVGNGHRVTLYQVKAAVNPDRLGNLAPPGVQVYSWQMHGSSFVLVGDLPQVELRDLARRLGG